MISEPELTGGDPDDPNGPDGYSKSDTSATSAASTASTASADSHPADLVADFDGAPRPAAAPRVRPPWVWVLGTVVATSVLWTGGLFVYDRGHSDLPDLHGYRIGASPCTRSVFKPLSDAVGATESQGSPAVEHHGPALDQTRCDFSAQAPYAQGGTTSYTVGVTVELHKRTDPREEFDDQARLDGASLADAVDIASVPGLGDEAFLATSGSQGQQLKVRHGGAVFSLNLNAYSDGNMSEDTLNGLGGGDYPLSPDLAQYQPVLIQVARNIMSGLQKKGSETGSGSDSNSGPVLGPLSGPVPGAARDVPAA